MGTYNSAADGSGHGEGIYLVEMDPHTGEILALAGWPVPNPNAPRTVEQLRNRPVTDAFEPGSTMKVFTVALTTLTS